MSEQSDNVARDASLHTTRVLRWWRRRLTRDHLTPLAGFREFDAHPVVLAIGSFGYELSIFVTKRDGQAMPGGSRDVKTLRGGSNIDFSVNAVDTDILEIVWVDMDVKARPIIELHDVVEHLRGHFSCPYSGNAGWLKGLSAAADACDWAAR